MTVASTHSSSAGRAFGVEERHFKAIVAQAHEGIWTINAEGCTTFVNPRMCEMLGYAEDEMLGQLHTEFMFEQDRPHGDVQMEHRRVGTREIWDQRYRRKDGEELWTLATCCPLHVDGVFVGALGMFADITERKTLERALQNSEARFRGTFENAAVGMAHVGLDGRWLWVNRRLCELLGFSHDELMGMTFRDITHPDDLAADLEQAERVKTGALAVYTMEKRYRRKDGTYFWGELTVSMLRDQRGRPLHYISVVQDTSARKQALDDLHRSREELLAASLAKDRFLATLSHELRTPLSPVLLVAGEAAHDDELSPNVREMFRSIEEAVLHQTRMIDDLLDVTRIVSGKLYVRKEPTALAALLQGLMPALQRQAEAKQLSLTAEFPAETLIVDADSARLRQIFHNLLGNAIKFTPPGGRVRLTLALGADEREAIVSISDTGLGMTQDEQLRLFQRFTQGDHAVQNPTRYGGLGLGLMISKTLVEQHGGSIHASSPGRGLGSVFSVTLPLRT